MPLSGPVWEVDELEAYLCHPLWQASADEVDDALGTPVERHHVPCGHVIRNQHMPALWNAIHVPPLHLDPQDRVEHCRRQTTFSRSTACLEQERRAELSSGNRK